MTAEAGTRRINQRAADAPPESRTDAQRSRASSAAEVKPSVRTELPAPETGTDDPATPVTTGTGTHLELWARAQALLAGGSFASVWLEMFECAGMERDRVQVVLRDPARRRVAESKLPWLGDLLSKAAGRRVRLEIVGGEADGEVEPEHASQETLGDSQLRQQAMDDPLVQRAMELFDARLIDARREKGDV